MRSVSIVITDGAKMNYFYLKNKIYTYIYGFFLYRSKVKDIAAQTYRMDHLWHDIVHFYNRTLENGDPRVSDWPMMQTPWPTICICLSYVYLVKYLAPVFMKNREPMNIRRLMVCYNFMMVGISLFTFYVLGHFGWFGKYNWRCQPVDYSDSYEATVMVHVAWWYYLSKYLEFIDTFFFVLRKKFSHVSTLHVIHHGVMPMSVWWGVKFSPGGHSTFFAFVNSFVHVLMYSYYGLAAMGPNMYKYLWWKKYMTTIQMVQFIIIFIHSFQLLFNSQCSYPRGFMWWIGFHAILFWFLFMDFYKNAYRKKTALAKKSNDTANGIIRTSDKSQDLDFIHNGICHNGIYMNGITKDVINRSNTMKTYKED